MKSTGQEWANALGDTEVGKIAGATREWAAGVRALKPSISGHVYWIGDEKGMQVPHWLAQIGYLYGIHGYWTPKGTSPSKGNPQEEIEAFKQVVVAEVTSVNGLITMPT